MRHLQQGHRCWCLVFDVAVLADCLARPAPPSVGGGLKAPGGDTAASQTLARHSRKARAEKKGTGKRLPHICQEVLLNVGSITKGRQEPWRLHSRAWVLQNRGLGLQNRGLGPAKSSLEPSKMPFLKDT